MIYTANARRNVVVSNSAMASVQIIVVGLSYFVLYKFLLKIIGIEKIGIWSVILATTSAANISNMGLASSIVKFVAKYHAREEYRTISGLIKTAFLSVAFCLGIMCFVLYFFIDWIMNFFLPDFAIHEAKEIVPYALGSLWLMGLNGILLSGIDGLQKVYLRSILLSIGTICYCALALILVKRFQLMGLAYAQIIQNVSLIIGAYVILKYYLHLPLSVMPKWSFQLFKEIVGYGANFQIISLSTMLYEPVTKMLLSRFGGLQAVGFYEMAQRLVIQFRGLLVNANNALVPTIAYNYEKDRESVSELYIKSFRIVFLVALSLFASLVVFIPIISELWIGSLNQDFILFSFMLSVGWFINILNVPAYFMYMGTGDLKWNVISHVVIAILNGLLGYVIGRGTGSGFGVVLAWVISLSGGSLIILVAYHKHNQLSFMKLFSENTYFIIGVCLCSLIVASTYRELRTFTDIKFIFLLYSVGIALMLWRHPLREQLSRMIQYGLMLRR
jgi:O-antigen/teichoic acid export membrane protein